MEELENKDKWYIETLKWLSKLTPLKLLILGVIILVGGYMNYDLLMNDKPPMRSTTQEALTIEEESISFGDEDIIIESKENE